MSSSARLPTEIRVGDDARVDVSDYLGGGPYDDNPRPCETWCPVVGIDYDCDTRKVTIKAEIVDSFGSKRRMGDGIVTGDFRLNQVRAWRRVHENPDFGEPPHKFFVGQRVRYRAKAEPLFPSLQGLQDQLEQEAHITSLDPFVTKEGERTYLIRGKRSVYRLQVRESELEPL